MNETKLNKKLSLAGYLCLIGCTLMITLSMTVSPREWMNVGLVIAVILGILAAGLSAASVSRQTVPEQLSEQNRRHGRGHVSRDHLQ